MDSSECDILNRIGSSGLNVAFFSDSEGSRLALLKLLEGTWQLNETLDNERNDNRSTCT